MDAWKKGEFGNPVGNGSRLKLNALRLFCQDFTPQAAKVIQEIILNSDNDSARFQAAKFVLEQAYGKAPHSMEIKITDGLSPSMMSAEQIKMFAAGKVRELVFSIIQSGQIEKYIEDYRENLTTLGKEAEKASGDENKQIEVKS
jgi:hypothetical protein